jgi:hypothetical protein
VATTAQVNKVSSDLATLEPKVTAAVAQASSLQATVTQERNQTAALRAELDGLRSTIAALTTAGTRTAQQLALLETANQTAAQKIAALTATVQELQATATNATDPASLSQQFATLASTDTRTAQQLALLEAANNTAAQQIAALAADNLRAAERLVSLQVANQTAVLEIAALKSASQQCTCGLELAAVNTTLATVTSLQQTGAAAISLTNATIETLRSSVAADAGSRALVNTTLATLAATVANLSAVNFATFVKTTDLQNIDAATLGGTPAAQYVRARVVLFAESATMRQGAFSGRSGADDLCSNSAARPAGLARVRAFLSTSSSDQVKDFTTLYGVPTSLAITSPVATVIAANFSSLFTSPLQSSLFAAKALSTPGFFWSGSLPDGSAATATCAGFTSSSAATSGEVGLGNNVDSSWLSFNSGVGVGCFNLAYVMCIAF